MNHLVKIGSGFRWIVALFFIGLSPVFSVEIAQKGFLDLSQINIQEQSNPVALDGEWAFFWKKLIPPSDFVQENPELPVPDIYSPFPKAWEKIDNGSFTPKGYATYRLKVKIGSLEPLGFYLRCFGTSYKLFINGETVVGSGIVSEKEELSYPRTVPVSFVYFPKTTELDLVLHISNYHYRTGGAWYPIEIGNQYIIQKKVYYSIFLDILIFGSVFIMGLYHIGIFINRNKTIEALFFGFFCILISFRTLVLGEKLLPFLNPNFSWELMMKTEYLSFYLGLPLFVNYFYILFKDIVHYKVVMACNILGLIFSLVVIFTGSYFYTHTVLYYQAVTLAFIIYGVVMLSIGIKRKIRGTLIFLISMLIFAGTIIHDFLYSNLIINTTYLAPMGFISFIFLQSYLLSKNFSRAFTMSEELALELKDKNEALTKLDKLKDDFMANTSHELKTPLNGIIGLSESLLDGAAGKISEKVAYNLSMIVTSGKRLANLVNDILDFSKMKSKEIKIEKRPVDIYSLVNLVLSLAHVLLANKKIDLHNAIPMDFPSAFGDENRIQQILYNLIGNAIKFTEKGRVEISAQIHSGIMEISISDTGIGIPEDKFEVIFQSFEQIDSASNRSYGGTGLGLAITKQLVELHGGKISVTSKMDEGSVFTFTLPVSGEKAETREDAVLSNISDAVRESVIDEDTISSDEVGNQKQYTIFIVDDEPINLQVLSNHLSLNHYSIIQASNGQEALEIMNSLDSIPDLILLDVMMPKMTGFEVCQKIREKYSASILPIVMLTAKNQTNDLVQGFVSGANDYLTKPFNKDELFTRIRNHLNLSKTSGAYEKFVPQEFIKLLGKESIIEVSLGDHAEKFMSVLFSDIRSFTTLSESMSPKDNFKFINSYLKRMSPIIHTHNGFIDKYIGDAIMALFPAEVDDAILSAISMLDALHEYNLNRHSSGYQPIDIGIGINTGNLMIGTVGGHNRMEGTVISDAVNLASRIESMTKVYGSNLLITENTYRAIQHPERYLIREIDQVVAKGKQNAVRIYEVFNSDSEKIREQKLLTQGLFSEAVSEYYNKEFQKAKLLFQQVKEKSPNDKATDYYLAKLVSS
jgi:two-component system, sensor histidine kinase ChiS